MKFKTQKNLCRLSVFLQPSGLDEKASLYLINVRIVETFHQRIIFHLQKLFDHRHLHLVHFQMDRNNFDGHLIERYGFKDLQLSAWRLQAEEIDVGLVHGEKERKQRKTFHSSVEPFRFPYQIVGNHAVDSYSVVVVMKSYLFWIRHRAEASVCCLRSYSIMPS